MDFTVFSHLRWNFVFQRPQHLMTRCARANRVFFWEEPICDAATARLEVHEGAPGLKVVVPHLPPRLSGEEMWRIQQSLLRELLGRNREHVFWYYTPLALNFSRDIPSRAIVYDCMDELSAFRGAPEGLRAAEKELFKRANLVFTGGRSLYESKSLQHPSVFCFPSSIDREFFAAARYISSEPPDQAYIPHPRLGYCGVIDERIDSGLLVALADARPEWQVVMLGPVVKINTSELPTRPNIHYLGQKNYQSLPAYLAGWDVGLLPFALNESTRFISPTKTPEYLAAGLPAVSTPIVDVVTPYGLRGLVHIAETPNQFTAAVEEAIVSKRSTARLREVDNFLSASSWDLTWARMDAAIQHVVRNQTNINLERELIPIGEIVSGD
jgi:glycosyltransferase involved in cell wall biosynthesis